MQTQLKVLRDTYAMLTKNKSKMEAQLPSLQSQLKKVILAIEDAHKKQRKVGSKDLKVEIVDNANRLLGLNGERMQVEKRLKLLAEKKVNLCSALQDFVEASVS